MAKTFRVVDLFAGCGGITAGFHRTGRFRTVGAVELDRAAATTYTENFGAGIVHQRSIVGWSPTGEARKADVVVGGPPCQGFSNLGAKRLDDPRNQLWREYVRVLTEIKPKVFVIENVDRFLKSDEFAALRAETLPGGELTDYSLDWDVVNAAEYGAAQIRRRTIVIGTRKDLEQIEIPGKTVKRREDWLTVAKALQGIQPGVHPENQLLPSGTVTHLEGPPIPGWFRSSDLHLTRNYQQLSLDRFRAIPAGGNRFDLPYELKSPCWRKHTTGSGDVMGRLRWDQPSVTIRTEFFKPEKGRYLHPTENRAITHFEAARLQGFDDDFRWCGSKVEIARQIGNAVPVQLAEAIARHLAAGLDGVAEPTGRLVRHPELFPLPPADPRAPKFVRRSSRARAGVR
ncbi:DNA cytosine methyltransferase [Paractinoplanes brasiliensis]|uniref:Cytosine-specific methyltransferase n=1 Tax=Paractinoplanes brasiliensis TaxID=52695 RepID=A0A4V3C869_9ACTN|nr:DNA cytosine methyltransferase [Actinoplanes brasiliensis]TDO39738.1 DNA (cytosine-5)-methyltransferase 1 [Actinoplanes brasiliensis]GID28925.1 cytosine-specific methyltransferase [Actinoplanes brasiliensis]